MDLRTVAWSSTNKIVLWLVSRATSPAYGRATGGLACFEDSSIEDCPIEDSTVEDSIAGRNTSMQVPRPGSLSTAFVPPDSLTMRCTVARPRPVPSPGFLVVKKGSNSRARVSASIPQPLSFTVSETARRALPGSELLETSLGNSPGNSAARVLNLIFPPCG